MVTLPVPPAFSVPVPEIPAAIRAFTPMISCPLIASAFVVIPVAAVTVNPVLT